MPDINKVFQTRIQLKYDTYANWSRNNPILKAGEMAIATVATGEQSMTNLPNIVLKVGDGVSHYNDLKFVSALAADVPGWAKESSKPVYAASEITGLADYIAERSDFDTDTDTQYRLVAVSGATYKYQLQSRAFANGAWGEWANVDGQVIDFSGADTRLKSLESTVSSLTGASGGIQEAINTAIQGLHTPEAGVKGSGNGVNVTVKQDAGIVTGVTVSVDANTYDVYGAASTVLGEDSDAAGAATVHGANKAAAEAKAAADAASAKVDNAINTLDGTVQATALSATDGSFGVLTKVVEENGIINQDQSAEIVLHKVAKSGKIDDLGQTAYIVFDCGSSSVNI